jgi:hypothetical protein
MIHDPLFHLDHSFIVAECVVRGEKKKERRRTHERRTDLDPARRKDATNTNIPPHHLKIKDGGIVVRRLGEVKSSSDNPRYELGRHFALDIVVVVVLIAVVATSPRRHGIGNGRYNQPYHYPSTRYRE